MKRQTPPFRKILIANRGEIALRIIRAVHSLGCRAVAVYSDPDESAMHVLYADEAYRIGPGPAAESYLNIEAILEAAERSGAEAIHPGYGFLSENADFAQAVVDAGLVFIGPPPDVIRLMGDKVAAKNLMAQNGVPLIPGYGGEDQSDDAFAAEADAIGYPVMVKAAAGGGGRGMRTVTSHEALKDALESARREAAAAFGEGRLFLEKLLVAPKHVEVQVLGGLDGTVIHLFERDCSVQRRHQKVIEEAPSPALDDRQRSDLCEAGVRAAKAAEYVNAGTVEFLWQEGSYYFLEMNTRIQVEHPVTELVTGRDLVRAQIEIAAGKPVPWKQEDIGVEGHAIEARLYAEDPANGFMPQPGRIESLEFGEANRIDTGVRAGSEISRFYDPLIAKIVTHSTTREEALDDLRHALTRTRVDGPKTNIRYLISLLDSPDFVRGQATTALADEVNMEPLIRDDVDDAWVLAAFATDLGWDRADGETAADGSYQCSPFKVAAGWRLGGQGLRLIYEISGRTHSLKADRKSDGSWMLEIDDHRPYSGVRLSGPISGEVVVRVGNAVRTFHWSPDVQQGAGQLCLAPDYGDARQIRRASSGESSSNRPVAGPGGAGAGRVESPMPGSIVKLHVTQGERVHAHQPLLVLEAMKMEHVLEAPHSGTVSAVHHDEGDLVSAGEPLVEIAAE